MEITEEAEEEKKREAGPRKLLSLRHLASSKRGRGIGDRPGTRKGTG